MKMTKRIFALALCLMLMMALALPAFAASGLNDTTGSITIENAHDGIEYNIYRILVLESYDVANNAYIFILDDSNTATKALWKAWIDNANGGGKYLELTSEGKVQWKGDSSEAIVRTFAFEALQYAQENHIAPTATKTGAVDGEGNVVVKFENLQLGYYLADSSAGALCAIDNVMPDSVLREKNLLPTSDKSVQDPTNLKWGDTAVAKVGQTVNFESTVTVYRGSENVTLHDRMDSSLQLVLGTGESEAQKYQNAVKIYVNDTTSEDNRVPQSIEIENADGETESIWTYEVVYNCTDDCENNHEGVCAETCVCKCTFEVKFNNAYLKTFGVKTELQVLYSAVLTEDAVIEGNGNQNESKISYGNNEETMWDDAVVYSYQIGIVKTNASNKVLTGAIFSLYLQETGGDPVKFVKENPTADNGIANLIPGFDYYRPATDEEIAAGTYVTTFEAGKVILWGVRTGVTMFLEEIKEPDGYNKLTSRKVINASDGSNLPTVSTIDGVETYVSGGVEVENLAGTQLPQTGGIGTTLFYVCGGLMVAIAVVLLVTKKRMAREN